MLSFCLIFFAFNVALGEIKALQSPVTHHVYSIQKKVPADIAQVWSEEFVQAEMLFKQNSQTSNCFWDNRSVP